MLFTFVISFRLILLSSNTTVLVHIILYSKMSKNNLMKLIINKRYRFKFAWNSKIKFFEITIEKNPLLKSVVDKI